MRNGSIESICVFGSAARKTTDSMSDKDVLAVSDSSARLSELTTNWAADGWSVAAYSPSQLEGMIKHGSLFVQHLKREGMLISDRQGWLGKKLSGAIPKKSYKNDLLRSVDLIKPLERLGDDQWSRYLAADLAFVFFRNFGIYSLAEKNCYEFDYHRVIEHLVQLHDLRPPEAEILHALRAWKVAYRGRRTCGTGNFDKDLLIAICTKTINGYRIRSIPKAAPIRTFQLKYATLRDAEAKLVSHFDISNLDEERLGKQLDIAWNTIRAPRDYSWAVQRIDEKWVRSIEHQIDKLPHYLSRCEIQAGQEMSEHQAKCGV